MNRATKVGITILMSAAGVALLLPLVIGLVDGWVWTMRGQQLSWINWDSDRVPLMFVFSGIGVVLVVSAIAVWDE